jgi:hypothetical protein
VRITLGPAPPQWPITSSWVAAGTGRTCTSKVRRVDFGGCGAPQPPKPPEIPVSGPAFLAGRTRGRAPSITWMHPEPVTPFGPYSPVPRPD